MVAAARAVGKDAGILVRDPSELPHRLTQGFTHIAVQPDLALIRDAFRTIVQSFAGIVLEQSTGSMPAMAHWLRFGQSQR